MPSQYQIELKLGEEETKVFAQNKHKIMEALEMTNNRIFPGNIKKELNSANSTEWKTAANYEMQNITALGVWEAVKPFLGVKALGCQWVFAIKPRLHKKPKTF